MNFLMLSGTPKKNVENPEFKKVYLVHNVQVKIIKHEDYLEFGLRSFENIFTD